MKKFILFIIIVIFFSAQGFTQINLKFLKIEIPTGSTKAKNWLLFNLEEIISLLN